MSGVDLGAGRAGDDELLTCCRWLLEAHADGDPQQIVMALCQLYRQLGRRGWVAPERASLLLRLQAAAVDLELQRLVTPARERE